MRKLLFVASFLATCCCSSLLADIFVGPEVGVTTPDGITTDFPLSLTSCGVSTDAVVSAVTSACFSEIGSGPGFTWSLTGAEDPFLSWTFGSTLPGTYTVTYITPIVGGLSYNTLQNAAGLTITNLTGAATTITDIDVKAEVPAGTNIGAVELTDSLFSVPAGTINGTAIGDATANAAFLSPASMEVVLSYTATGSGSVGFTGQALLTETTAVTPEPGSYAALILAFGGIMLLVRSRRAKQHE
jgi:hypothetical protein